MANPEHVKVLREGGVNVWNNWRQNNADIIPDLQGESFESAALYNANLSHADLTNANLFKGFLRRTNFNGAILRGATLDGADLTNATLVGANLQRANLRQTFLENTDFSNAILVDANFRGAQFNNTILTWAKLGFTILGLTDLSSCIGLETVIVHNLCVIDFQTLRASQNLPKEFLTKVGIPELLMEYLPDFYNSGLMIYPAFLSHSWADKEFVRKLYEGLIQKGVTIWLDEKEMKPGDNIHDSIADAIKYYDKLILVCSEKALNSWWVEKELERVYEKERQLQKQHGKKFRLVIPIMIDDKILGIEGGIFDTLRNSKIGDFTGWQDDGKFEKVLGELVDALNANRLEIKPPSFL